MLQLTCSCSFTVYGLRTQANDEITLWLAAAMMQQQTITAEAFVHGK